ncbi:MAG: cysteine desulfurase [Bdellovibrionales bacterium]|nr:cysteine desulfurase [Bdellovibrionales bacterium]
MSKNLQNVKCDFPILQKTFHGKRLTYLDSAASTQKPNAVIDCISNFLKNDYANIHRGVYALSQRSTERYEKARRDVAQFIHAKTPKEIVFLRGTTEGINLIANTFGRARVGQGDEVLISSMEHHSNIVPWQLLCLEKKAQLKTIPMFKDGSLDLSKIESLISSKTKLISIVHVSNALGTINPIKDIVEIGKKHDIPVIVDGAQSAAHLEVNVQELGCDFFIFSGHKVYGPTGIGALYGRYELLKEMPPYQGGGEMIESVSFEKSTFKLPPDRFEAGTPDIMGAVGLSAAIEYISEIGFDTIGKHEATLLKYAHKQLQQIKGLEIIGTALSKSGVISFVLDGIHPHDIATILDQDGIAVRAGHHCAQPVMDYFGVPATTRASIGIYNNEEDIDALVSALHHVQEIFK